MHHPHNDGARQGPSRGLGSRTLSSKTQSVIGVSADPHAGFEDWTNGFSLAQPLTNKLSSPAAPNSPASQRAAALLRIAKEKAPRQQHRNKTRSAAAEVATAPPPTATTAKLTQGSSRRELGDPSTELAAKGMSRAGRSRGPANSTISGGATAPTASSSSSSRSKHHHRTDHYQYHRGDGDNSSDLSGRHSSRRDREEGKSSSSKKQRQESNRSRRTTTHTIESNSSYTSSSRAPVLTPTRGGVGGSRERGGEEEEEEAEQPYSRWGREEREAKKHSAVARSRTSRPKVARPWDDIVEEMNDDSPTESEILPAPQPRALRTPSSLPTPRKEAPKVSHLTKPRQEERAKSCVCACLLLPRVRNTYFMFAVRLLSIILLVKAVISVKSFYFLIRL